MADFSKLNEYNRRLDEFERNNNASPWEFLEWLGRAVFALSAVFFTIEAADRHSNGAVFRFLDRAVNFLRQNPRIRNTLAAIIIVPVILGTIHAIYNYCRERYEVNQRLTAAADTRREVTANRQQETENQQRTDQQIEREVAETDNGFTTSTRQALEILNTAQQRGSRRVRSANAANDGCAGGTSSSADSSDDETIPFDSNEARSVLERATNAVGALQEHLMRDPNDPSAGLAGGLGLSPKR